MKCHDTPLWRFHLLLGKSGESGEQVVKDNVSSVTRLVEKTEISEEYLSQFLGIRGKNGIKQNANGYVRNWWKQFALIFNFKTIEEK